MLATKGLDMFPGVVSASVVYENELPIERGGIEGFGKGEVEPFDIVLLVIAGHNEGGS